MISVTCGVRDRAAHLDVSLRSWLACEEVGEVLVVDWTSREPVTPPHDERAVLVRVEGQARWHSSKCHNLELLLAWGEEILRLDADHVLRPGFFARHPAPEKGYFYRYAITPQSPENEKHLAGAVYARREHFMRVGGATTSTSRPTATRTKTSCAGSSLRASRRSLSRPAISTRPTCTTSPTATTLASPPRTFPPTSASALPGHRGAGSPAASLTTFPTGTAIWSWLTPSRGTTR